MLLPGDAHLQPAVDAQRLHKEDEGEDAPPGAHTCTVSKPAPAPCMLSIVHERAASEGAARHAHRLSIISSVVVVLYGFVSGVLLDWPVHTLACARTHPDWLLPHVCALHACSVLQACTTI
jgi:hypothetical protein